MRATWFLLAVGLLAAACGEDSGGAVPIYEPCATAADCSSATPECVAFSVSPWAAPMWCTATCAYDGDCTFPGGVTSVGACVGVTPSGVLDVASPARYCLEYCRTAEHYCNAGWSCATTTYDGQPASFCVPDPL